MGMFDYVNYEDNCPSCGSKLEKFQSKNLECELKTVQPSSVTSFYTSCNECQTWVQYTKEDNGWLRTATKKDHISSSKRIDIPDGSEELLKEYLAKAITEAYKEGFFDGHGQGSSCGHDLADKCDTKKECLEHFNSSNTELAIKELGK